MIFNVPKRLGILSVMWNKAFFSHDCLSYYKVSWQVLAQGSRDKRYEVKDCACIYLYQVTDLGDKWLSSNI
jgi:hypothetical protein